jgi:hypothetical protein
MLLFQREELNELIVNAVAAARGRGRRGGRGGRGGRSGRGKQEEGLLITYIIIINKQNCIFDVMFFLYFNPFFFPSLLFHAIYIIKLEIS